GPSKLPDTGTLTGTGTEPGTSGEHSIQNEQGKDFIVPGVQLADSEGEADPDGTVGEADLHSRREAGALAAREKRELMDSLEKELLLKKNPLMDPSAQEQGALAREDSSKALDRGLIEGNKAKEEEQAIALQEEAQGKKSIYEAILEQEGEEEEALAARERGRWSVGPSVAPVYFDASGQGSPIHSEVASNSKSGNFNMSYGLNVAYEMGKKVKIRTGVHRVNYGYDTNGVSFSSSMAAAASQQNIGNIDYRENSRHIVVRSNTIANSPNFMDSPSELASKEVAL